MWRLITCQPELMAAPHAVAQQTHLKSVNWQVAPSPRSTRCHAAVPTPSCLAWHNSCTHLAVGDVAGDVPNGKDAQEAVVVPPRIVHHPAGGVKPASHPQPVPYPGGLLLWAVEAVFAMEDSGLICLAEPGDQKCDLQGQRQAADLLSQIDAWGTY